MTLRKLLGGLLVALALSVALVPVALAGHSGGPEGPVTVTVPPTFDNTFSYGPGENTFSVIITEGDGPLQVSVKDFDGTTLASGVVSGAAETLTVSWTSDEPLQNVQITVTNVDPNGNPVEFEWLTN